MDFLQDSEDSKCGYNPCGNSMEVFYYLCRRYSFLSYYLQIIQRYDKMCDTIINDQNGPFQYLFACPKLLFFKEEMKCLFDETKLVDIMLKTRKTKDITKNCQSQHGCISLNHLGKMLTENSIHKRVSDGIYEEKFKPHEPEETALSLCIEKEMQLLEDNIKSHLPIVSKANSLNICDGYTLISEQIDGIIIADKKCSKAVVDLSMCTNNWCVYAAVLAAECIRAIAVLLYPYCWQKKNSLLTWDVTCCEYKTMICIIENACCSMIKLAETSQVTDTCKRKYILMAAVVKDSVIRLGIGINVLQPLNPLHEPVHQLLNNRFFLKSEIFASSLYISKHNSNDQKAELQKLLSDTNLLRQIKSTENYLDHSAFYSIAESFHKETFSRNMDFGKTLEKIETFLSVVGEPKYNWMVNSDGSIEDSFTNLTLRS